MFESLTMLKWYLNVDPAGSHPKQQRIVASVDELEDALMPIIENGEGSAILSQTEIGAREKSDFMLVGVCGDAAFAHFNPIDPPGTPQNQFRDYLWAVSVNRTPATDEDLEFDIGGTSTPIPARRCIPKERMLSIVKEYFEKQILSDSVEWEVDDA
jgi:hypothetical protein